MAGAEEEGTAAEAEVAQAAAGKVGAGIAVAGEENQALPAVAVLTMTHWSLISRALLAGADSATSLVTLLVLGYLQAETHASKEQQQPMGWMCFEFTALLALEFSMAFEQPCRCMLNWCWF